MRIPKWFWLVGAIGILALDLALARRGISRYQRDAAYYSAAATLPEEIKAAKQERLPLTPADLIRPDAVPDEQNAALLYMQLPQVNVYPKDDDYLKAVIKGKATNADRQAARRLLAKAAPQLQLVEKAASQPDCDFHRNWKLGPNMPLPPEYGPARETARLLAAQAMLQSEEGHPEAALHTIWVGARMAQALGKDPMVLALLMRIAIEAILDRSFQRIVNKYADRPDILRLAEQTEQTFGPTPDVGHALRGELVMCRITADMVRKDEAQSLMNVTFRIPVTGTPRTVLADAYEARSLSFWRRVFAAVRATPDDPMATYRAFKAVNEAEEAMEIGMDGKPKPTYEFCDLLCPYFSGAAEKVVRNEAQRRLRRTLYALVAYRQREGQFPATLASISLSIPSDPYIGQPFHYHRTEKGFLLYSVGPDLKDDGGSVTPAKKGDLPPDIVVSFP